MKDRYQNITRAGVLALGIGMGSALALNGSNSEDISYREKIWGINVPTKEGDAYCYSDIMPENRVLTIISEDGVEKRWWDLKQFDFACDNGEVIGLNSGENIIFLGIGSSFEEPVLEKLR